MGLTIQKTNVTLTGRKKALEVGLIIWILALILSMLIMGILGIHPENESENWGINHPKYLQFELLMILTMIILMFGFVQEFYKQQRNLIPSIDVLTDGFIIMVIQFIMDFMVLVVLMKAGLAYFYGLVILVYITIPFQWLIFAKMGNLLKQK